jgi:two-component system response regulator RpfG
MLVTVVGDEPLRQAALDAGIIDFMVKPIRPRELRSRCKNLLELRQRQQALKSRTHVLEHQLVSGTQEMEQSELNLLMRLARLAGQREGMDLQSLHRLSALAGLIARGLGLEEGEARKIERAAQLHDLGNIGIPDAILNQPGPLLEDERLLMQQHTVFGHEVLQGGSGLLQLSAEIALGHHERWDGAGYPTGLAGEQIPLSARIVAAADVLDALLSPRPYRDKWPMDRALRHMGEQAGLHFDPAVIKVVLTREAEIVAMHAAFGSI